MTRKIIITGATGFVGKNLVSELNEDTIYAIVRRGSKNNQSLDNRIIQIESDLNNPDLLRDDLDKLDIDFSGAELYHLAALLGANQAWNKDYERVNVQSTVVLAEFALRNNISKFIFLSSMGAAGPQGSLEDPMSEETICKPLSIYSKSKLKAEIELMKLLDGKIALSMYRAPNIYGEEMNMSSGAGMIFSGLRKKVFPIIGNGNAVINLVYIKNLINAIITCSVDERSEVFFISDGDTQSMNSMIYMVKSAWKSNTKIIKIPKYIVYPFVKIMDLISILIGKNIGFNSELYVGMVSNSYNFSIEKAKKFGYDPEFSLEEGIERTVNYVKALNEK